MKDFAADRKRMVEQQIMARGIKDKKVLDALTRIPRHRFVPENMQKFAYRDEPLSIGEGQTISQPYIVAFMTEVLRLGKKDKILEIGTGSGYQTAVLSSLVSCVCTIEIVASLSKRAQLTLEGLGFRNILFRIGDGTYGWEEESPFDAVMVTAAPKRIPEILKKQMAPNGRMIIPVGDFHQELIFITRTKTRFQEESLLPVRFVPLVTTQ